MRRWWTVAAWAAGLVADRPALWLPGALAWSVSVGWLALLVGVIRPPGTAELTFLGAGLYTSGTWPWNVIGLSGLLAGVAAVAVFLGSLGEAVLLRGRRASARMVSRLAGLTAIVAGPSVIALLILGIALVAIAPGEFNAPDAGADPLLRTLRGVLPVVVVAAMLLIAGSTMHAAAARHVAAGRGVAEALWLGFVDLRTGGAAVWLHVLAVTLGRLVFLVLSAALLRVLWSPIGLQLDVGQIDPGTALLLVGFVAIWLCLVLGGGALHAWGSVTWSRLLGARIQGPDEPADDMENSPTP
jgi:hypothetical protein